MHHFFRYKCLERLSIVNITLVFSICAPIWLLANSGFSMVSDNADGYEFNIEIQKSNRGTTGASFNLNFSQEDNFENVRGKITEKIIQEYAQKYSSLELDHLLRILKTDNLQVDNLSVSRAENQKSLHELLGSTKKHKIVIRGDFTPVILVKHIEFRRKNGRNSHAAPLNLEGIDYFGTLIALKNFITYSVNAEIASNNFNPHAIRIKVIDVFYNSDKNNNSDKINEFTIDYNNLENTKYTDFLDMLDSVSDVVYFIISVFEEGADRLEKDTYDPAKSGIPPSLYIPIQYFPPSLIDKKDFNLPTI